MNDSGKYSKSSLALAVVLSFIGGLFTPSIFNINLNLQSPQNSFNTNTQTNIGTQNLPQCSPEEFASLKQELGSIKSNLETCTVDSQNLRNKLDLYEITLTGKASTVTTGTLPTDITFEYGNIKHGAKINDGTYQIKLVNNRPYTVTITYFSGPIPGQICKPEPNPFNLQITDKNQQFLNKDWSC